MSVKFAVIADLHLPYLDGTVQYAAFDWAIDEVNKQDCDFVMVAGDITTNGDDSAFEYFGEKIKEISSPCYVLPGNADLRNKGNIDKALNLRTGFTFEKKGMEFVCVNTATGSIEESDIKTLENSGKNAIVFMHHGIHRLSEKSALFMKEWASDRSGYIIHAHSHISMDSYIGKTRVVGVRCLDPEKSVGAPPCITFFTLSENELAYEDKNFDFPKDNLSDFRESIGISCFDIYGDIDFAIENNVRNIEIRKFDGSDEELAYLIEKVDEWRKKGGKKVSVHMTNLKWNGENFDGLQEWAGAVRIAKALKAENATVHPPRKVMVSDMERGSDFYENVLNLFYQKLTEIPSDTKIGIENIHFDINDTDIYNRFFGYQPDELMEFVDDINKKFSYDRAGMVFDIGHAKNNGPCYTGNTIGVWLKKIGKRITAYHIHQVAEGEKGKINHAAISAWEGERNICFTAFLWAWQAEQVNHAPMFMEMRKIENCKISLESLEKYLRTHQ